MPACDAGGDEPLRGGDAHTSTPASRRPAVSGRPSARFAFCTAWPAAPLPRLSSAQTTIAGPGRAVGEDADLGAVGALDARELGRDARPAARVTAGEAAYAASSSVAQVRRSRSRSRWRAGPRRTGSRCGTKQTGKPSACAISGACWCEPTLYGETFSSTEAACDDAFSVRPAPETPDFASTTTPAGSIASASGASASSDGGRVAAGVRDQRPVRREELRDRVAPVAERAGASGARSRTTPDRATASASRCAPERSTTTASAGGSSAAARSWSRQQKTSSAPAASASSFVTNAGSEPFSRGSRTLAG